MIRNPHTDAILQLKTRRTNVQQPLCRRLCLRPRKGPPSSGLVTSSATLELTAFHNVRQSRHSHSSSWLAHGGSRMEGSKCRPVSGATVIRRSRQASPSPTPSDGWETESIASDDAPGFTSSTLQSPQPSFSVAGTSEEPSSLNSFQPARWQQSSPTPAEEPRLDSSCTSISDPPTPTCSLPKTSARLNLFPKIQQPSYESLGRQYHSEYDKDPFYTVLPDQAGDTEWTSSLNPTPNCEAGRRIDIPNAEGSSAQEPTSPLGRPRRKDHRLREMLSPVPSARRGT